MVTTKFEDCGGNEKQTGTQAEHRGQDCALQAEATEVRFASAKTDTDKTAAATALEGYPSKQIFGDAASAFERMVDHRTILGDQNAYASAFRAVEHQFDESLHQADREFGLALLKTVSKLGLTSADPLMAAVRNFNEASNEVGSFAKTIGADRMDRVMGDLRDYFAMDRSTPAAKQLELQLPAGLIQATERFRDAASDPKYRAYQKEVAPLVINRLEILTRYSEIAGAAGATPKQLMLQRQLDEAMRSN